MAKRNVDDLIEEVLGKSDRAYVPTGIIGWRLLTGVPSLDRILGGGLPSGSFTQIYGPEQSGKTSLAYRIAGQAVKMGKDTLLVPLEGYDEIFARACGIDTSADNFHVFSADFAELTFNMCIQAVRDYGVEVVVMDSISAAVPRKDLEKEQKVEDGDPGFNVGNRARSIGSFVGKLQMALKRRGAIFVTVNRLTASITKMGGSMVPAGGMVLQYDSDIKINMWGRAPSFKDMLQGKNIIESSVSVTKGKMEGIRLFGATELYCLHGVGIDIHRDLITESLNIGTVEKSGAWFKYGDYKFQGMTKFADELRINEELYNDLTEKVNTSIALREAVKVTKLKAKSTEEDDEEEELDDTS